MKMYSSDICPGCLRFKATLLERGVENPFEVVNITENVMKMREFLKIRDNHPKYVISATPLLTTRDEDGIKHISLREFLSKGL